MEITNDKGLLSLIQAIHLNKTAHLGLLFLWIPKTFYFDFADIPYVVICHEYNRLTLGLGSLWCWRNRIAYYFPVERWGVHFTTEFDVDLFAIEKVTKSS